MKFATLCRVQPREESTRRAMSFSERPPKSRKGPPPAIQREPDGKVLSRIGSVGKSPLKFTPGGFGFAKCHFPKLTPDIRNRHLTNAPPISTSRSKRQLQDPSSPAMGASSGAKRLSQDCPIQREQTWHQAVAPLSEPESYTRPHCRPSMSVRRFLGGSSDPCRTVFAWPGTAPKSRPQSRRDGARGAETLLRYLL